MNSDILLGSPLQESAATVVVGAITPWDQAQEHIRALLRLKPDWDGEGASPVRPDLIQSALQLTNKLIADEMAAPHDIYPLPDGNILLEWQQPDGIIQRIEIEEVGQGELMITYPDAPAQFSKLTWLPTVAPSGSTVRPS